MEKDAAAAEAHCTSLNRSEVADEFAELRLILSDVRTTSSRIGPQVDEILQMLEGEEAQGPLYMYSWAHGTRIQEVRDLGLGIHHSVHQTPRPNKFGAASRYRRVAVQKGGVQGVAIIKRFQAAIVARHT